MSTKLVGPIQFQGKLGTIVGRATRKGNISVGMAPTKYTNPNTPKQRTARTRFLAVTTFCSAVPQEAFAGLVRASKSGKMSLRNAAFKVNMAVQNANKWQDQDTTTGIVQRESMIKDYLKFSKGVYNAAIQGVSADTPNTVVVTFTKNNLLPAAADTKLIHHVILYCRDLGAFYHKAVQADIDAATTAVEVTVPNSGWMGLDVWVYGYTQFNTDANNEIDYTALTNNISAKSEWMAAANSLESTDTLFAGKVTIA